MFCLHLVSHTEKVFTSSLSFVSLNFKYWSPILTYCRRPRRTLASTRAGQVFLVLPSMSKYCLSLAQRNESYLLLAYLKYTCHT